MPGAGGRRYRARWWPPRCCRHRLRPERAGRRADPGSRRPSVEVYEGEPVAGGGCRSAELTLPGFRHDICSAVHPLVAASPFFRSVDLAARGVKLLTPEVSFAHPLDGGRAGAVVPSVDETAASLGDDGAAYRRLFGPLVRDVDKVLPTLLGPLRRPPRHPLAMARLGLPGLLPVTRLAARFQSEEAKGLLAGAAAHSMLPLSTPLTGSYGLLFITLGHAYGWPVVEGGSERVVEALVAELADLGATVRLEPVGQQLERATRGQGRARRHLAPPPRVPR